MSEQTSNPTSGQNVPKSGERANAGNSFGENGNKETEDT